MSSSGEPPAARGPGGWEPVRLLGPSRRIGEMVSLIGALLLAGALVGLRWYGAAGTGGLERPGPSRSLGAWQSMTVARWLVVATAALTLGAAAVRVLRRGRTPGAGIAGALALAGGATALVLTYRVLINPPQPDRVFDVKLGAALGLTGAVAIAAGSFESWHRARQDRGLSAGRPRHGVAATGRLARAR